MYARQNRSNLWNIILCRCPSRRYRRIRRYRRRAPVLHAQGLQSQVTATNNTFSVLHGVRTGMSRRGALLAIFRENVRRWSNSAGTTDVVRCSICLTIIRRIRGPGAKVYISGATKTADNS